MKRTLTFTLCDGKSPDNFEQGSKKSVSCLKGPLCSVNTPQRKNMKGVSWAEMCPFKIHMLIPQPPVLWNMTYTEMGKLKG